MNFPNSAKAPVTHNLWNVTRHGKTGCKRRQGHILHIMTPSFEADTLTVSWSQCSRRHHQISR
ncbi:hypothetical protein NQ317_018001, partial [Molorchus minor]